MLSYPFFINIHAYIFLVYIICKSSSLFNTASLLNVYESLKRLLSIELKAEIPFPIIMGAIKTCNSSKTPY